MKFVRAFIGACLLISSSVPLNACPTFEEARRSYFNGENNAAKEALLCIEKEFPNDRDSLKLLADLYRLEGRETLSEEILERVYLLSIKDPLDAELAIYSLRRISRAAFGANYQSVWASRDAHTHEYNIYGQYRVLRKNILQLGFDQVSKSFQAADSRSDSSLRLGAVVSPGQQTYVETYLAYSPTNNFSPEWKISVEPHFVFQNESDVSLASRISFYRETTSVLLKPSWSRPFGSYFVFGLTSDIVLKPDFALASGGFMQFFLLTRLATKLSLSGGKTDDGDGILDTFVNVGASVNYRLFIPLEVSINGAVYRGENRDEYRLGSGFTWIF